VKNLRFTYHIDEKLNDMVLLGDAFRLRQILINMLSNAIKFTTQGYVELRSFIKTEVDDTVWVRFDVIDTGIGISPDKIDTVFEEFKQASSAITMRYGGTGLGLTICKKLIELQRGSLSVASQEGIGTTFTFSIPYKRGKETDIVPPDFGTVDSEKLRNRHVLLADDDSVNRLLGKTILEKFNCRYDIANSGEEAIEKLKQEAYDIILLDIHMPDVNGLEVAKFLRRKKGDESTKIIAVTAAFMQHDVKEFYKVGINDFLIKPFKEVNLFNKMCDVLKIKTVSKKRQKTEIILEEYRQPKPYNLKELEKMAGQDKDFVSKMLLTFIDNAENTILLLPKLLKAKDWEQIGETAHKILPSYRHLEVNGIVSKLVELKNKTLIKPDHEAVPSLVESTLEEMKSLVSELKQETDS
jgi:CheY-like chemotaxis protein